MNLKDCTTEGCSGSRVQGSGVMDPESPRSQSPGGPVYCCECKTGETLVKKHPSQERKRGKGFGKKRSGSPEKRLLPDFKGMGMREVLKQSRALGLKVSLKGSGLAAEQKPCSRIGNQSDKKAGCKFSTSHIMTQKTMPLKQLLKGIPVSHVSGDLSVGVVGLAYDSRKVKPGFVFIALKGHHLDGRQFIDGAVSRGAVAIVQEGFDGNMNGKSRIKRVGNLLRIFR